MIAVGVIGPGEAATSAECDTAELVGKALATAGFVVVTGGLLGVMESASRGAKSAGGVTIGLLPGTSMSTANRWVDIALPTGMGELRNGLLMRSVAAVVAVGGSWGTASEIAFAMRRGIPCAAIGGWTVTDSQGEAPSPSPHRSTSPDEAVRWICAQLEAGDE